MNNTIKQINQYDNKKDVYDIYDDNTENINYYNKNPNKKQIGGEKLSEGGYGCVYYPGLYCSGKEMTGTDAKKFVSKVQVFDDSAKNEVHIGNIIKDINIYEQHFVPIIETCPIRLAEIDKGLVKSCNLLKDKNIHNSSTKTFSIMKIRYIDSTTFSDYIEEVKNPKKLLNDIFESYKYLLRSLDLLYENDIIHYDLKGENILYDRNKNHPLIIDFGLSIDMNGLKKEEDYEKAFYIYAPDYYIWCPEIQVLSYLYRNNHKPSKKEYKNIAIECVKHNKGLHSGLFSNTIIKKYEKDLISELQKYHGKSRNVITKELLKKSSYSWDNYSLSILFLRIIGYIYDNSEYEDGYDYDEQDYKDDDKSHTNKGVIELFSELLLKNISPNPKERYTIEQTKKAFEGLFIVSKDDDVSDRKSGLFNMYDSIIKSIYKKKESGIFDTILQKDEEQLEIVSKKIYNK